MKRLFDRGVQKKKISNKCDMKNATKSVRNNIKKVMVFSLAMGLGVAGIALPQSQGNKVLAATGFSAYDFLKTNGDAVRNNYGRGNN